MTSVTAYPAFMTVEEFEAFRFPEGKVELVRGEPRVMPPAGVPHGGVGSNLLRMLLPFVHDHRLGRAFGDGVGYVLSELPQTVRNPDASFVIASRLSSGGLQPGFFKGAPDLAVEVLSPSETAWELQEKLDDYRVAGTRLVWVLDPTRRTVNVVPQSAPARWLHEGDVLDGGDVIPGFECSVSALFEGIAPLQKHQAKG